MAEVVSFPGHVTPAEALEGSASVDLESVIVIGDAGDGELYLRMAGLDRASALWLIENARHLLITDPEI